MIHPSEDQLALYFGGELKWWERLRLSPHLRNCAICQGELQALHESREHLGATLSELPPNLNWNRLSAEMLANISLGFQAGEIVGPVRQVRVPRIEWRPVLALMVAAVAIVTAWWLNPPSRVKPHAGVHLVELRTTAAGIELSDNGRALTLHHAGGEQRPLIVSSPGTLRARYVDTYGQVNINNVYSE